MYSKAIAYDKGHFSANHDFFTEPKIAYGGKFFKTVANTVLTAHQDLAVRKFTVSETSAEEVGVFVSHFDYVRYVEIANNDAFYITTCQDGSLRLWDSESNTPRHLYSGHEQIVSCVAVTQDNRLAISACYD